MRNIDVNRGHDLRTVARLLSDRSIPGPLYLHDEDGEQIAVMIRAQAWDPRLDRFVFIDGRYRCDDCRRAGTGHALPPPGVSLAALVEAANAHWREAHRPKQAAPAGAPGGIPLTKTETPRTANGYVANLYDAQERLGSRYGCAAHDVKQLRNAQTVIGWRANVGNRFYYLLRDGRADGPFAGEHSMRQAAYKAAARTRKEEENGAE